MFENFEKIAEKQTELKKKQKQLQEESESIFLDGVKEIFQACSDLKSASWTQYTPYFNDGDACVFDVNIDYLRINDDDKDSNESLNPNLVINRGKWNNQTRSYEGRIEAPNPKYNISLSKGVDILNKFLKNFDDDFYKKKFGDHVEITLTSEGVNVEEIYNNPYDHD